MPQKRTLKQLEIYSDPNNSIECWPISISLYAYKKGPDKVLYRGLQKNNFNLLLGFRFLSFFFSFNNSFRD